jgi:hypothetical protein
MQIEGIFPRLDFSMDGLEINDNGGARSGRDRRKLAIITRNPERRIGQERRSGIDRRNGPRHRGELAVERRDKFEEGIQ